MMNQDKGLPTKYIYKEVADDLHSRGVVLIRRVKLPKDIYYKYFTIGRIHDVTEPFLVVEVEYIQGKNKVFRMHRVQWPPEGMIATTAFSDSFEIIPPDQLTDVELKIQNFRLSDRPVEEGLTLSDGQPKLESEK